MPTSVSKCSVFIVFIWLLHLFTFIGGRPVKPGDDNKCEFSSAVWKGGCVHPYDCGQQCKAKEGATGGNCDTFRCHCEYKCTDFCESLSGTWHGPCFQDAFCSKQCREREGKFRGYCPDYRCWCVDYCSKA